MNETARPDRLWDVPAPEHDVPAPEHLAIRHRYEVELLEDVYHVYAPSPYLAAVGLLRERCHIRKPEIQLSRINQCGTRIYIYPKLARLEIHVREAPA